MLEKNLQNRIMGVITLKAPIYREIADDQTATTQALTVFVIVTLVSKLFSGFVSTNASGTPFFSFGGGIVSAIFGVIVGLIGLYFTAWVLAFVAQRLGGKTSTSEMVRVTGFVSVFGLVAVINILTLISPSLVCLTSLISLAVAILSIVAYTIGVREAAEFSTTNAIITAVIAVVVNFVVVVLIAGGILTAILGAMALSGH
jgi:hypothetical protein